jgi:hypothetical protein
MPRMRASLRWALTLLIATLALIAGLSIPAFAGPQTLTPSPATGSAGTKVTLTYDTHPQGEQQCQSGFTVLFTVDGKQVAARPLRPDCTATALWTVPSAARCPTQFALNAGVDAQQQDGSVVAGTQASNVFLKTCPQAIATVTRKPSPTPSPTASPTPSPTPTPTATPSATPKATPTKTLAPTTGQTPVVAVAPPDFPTPGGSSGTPWVVGGIVLGLAGVGASLILLRPKAGAPIAIGASVLSVAVGAGLVLLAPADQSKPVITGSYTAGAGEGCAKGDIPLSGGFYDLDTPTALLRFHPAGSSSGTGYWNVGVGGTGQGSTVCLRLGRSVVWRVREAALPATKPSGSVSCQTPESLLGGGFAYPWGLSGLSSHPEAPMRWTADDAPYTDGPAPVAGVHALCAELPDGLRTYVTSGSTHGPGEAVASCFPGDAVLDGGFSGSQIQASYPVDGGWLTQTVGGGMSYASCFHPSRAFGLRGTYTRYGDDGHARCDGTDTVLGGGWDGGTDLDGLQHFEPLGNGWNVTRTDSGNVTAYVLCARRWA